MFKKLECVCIHTVDIEQSLPFYVSLGLTESWRINRELDGGAVWTLIGLRFPERSSSELVLSNHPELNFTEIEIAVDDVRQAYAELSLNPDIKWIQAPFATESGHVAVMEAPDGNAFVLVGK